MAAVAQDVEGDLPRHEGGEGQRVRGDREHDQGADADLDQRLGR
jgi:hypothetical protein